MKRALLLLSLLWAAGCSDPEGGSDASMSTHDAALSGDAATAMDAGVEADGGGISEDAAAGDASASSDGATDAGPFAGTGSCDARRVLCESLPPSCEAGEAPSVEGSCWGPCIAATRCICTTAEECPDVRGFSETCHTGRGFCGPFL